MIHYSVNLFKQNENQDNITLSRFQQLVILDLKLFVQEYKRLYGKNYKMSEEAWADLYSNWLINI